MIRIHVVKAEKVTAWEFRPGDRALLLDDRGRGERWVIQSEAFEHPNSGEPMVQCSPPDAPSDLWDIKALALLPCDRHWRLLGERPVELRVSWRDGANKGDLPLRARAPTDPILQKADRGRADRAEPVALPDDLTDHQLAVLAVAQARGPAKSHALLEALANDIHADTERTAVMKGANERRILEANRQEVAREEHLAAIQRELIEAGATPAAVSLALRHERLKLQRIDAIRRGEGGIAPRLTSGLDELFEAGSIDAAEHAAGERYGEMWDAALSSIKVSNPEAVGGAGVPDFDGRAVKVLDQSARLQELEAEVRNTIRRGRALWVLRLVAGRGMCISHFSKGASRAKNVEALQLVLELLAIRWGLK